MSDVFVSKHKEWESLSFDLGDRRLLAATWIDNIFVYAGSSLKALHIIRDFESELERCWSLAIKPTSREVLVCKGLKNEADESIWSCKSTMRCLGHILSYDGSIWPDWRDCKVKMWSVF